MSPSRAWLPCAVIVGGCMSAPSGAPVEVSPDGDATRLVTEPAHGAVVAGDPLAISLHVAGTCDAARSLDVQLLGNPNDLTSWTTIATTEADASGQFAIDVQPVTGERERSRWPAGGVLRLRVVDDDGEALPHDPADATASVIAVVNPAAPPAAWAYLAEKPVGTAAETTAYYQAIGAPPRLADFISKYQLGTSSGATVVRYYNQGDLGIGREMHCRQTSGLIAGGLACYVRNFGAFGGDRDHALDLVDDGGTPLATVAMVYVPPLDAPNAVRFMVYGPGGALATESQLDTQGDNKSVPQSCLNCHGGRASYDPQQHAVTGARFLAFDPGAFEFSSLAGLTLEAQQRDFQILNQMIAATSPTPAMLEVIDGMFSSSGAYDPAFVPAGWRDSPRDARLYREVIAPYCRSCHNTFDQGPSDPAAFAAAADLRAKANGAAYRVCTQESRGMPAAEATAAGFFRSGARGLLLTWLDAPGTCAH